MKTICMLTSDHSPLDDRIYYKEARSLIKAGYTVTMVCHADSDGKVWDMGRKELVGNSDEPFDLDGMMVYAIPRPATTWEKLTNKIFKSAYFIESIQQVVALKPDVIHCHEPASLYIAFKAAELIITKIVFDSHESWQGGTAKEELIKALVFQKLEFLISANSITRGNLLTANRNLKTEVIYNFANPNDYPQELKWEKLEDPIIVHDGYMFFDRGLKDILEAIRLLKQDFPKIKLRILGSTKGEEKEYLKKFTAEHSLHDNIEETGWVPYKKVGTKLADCSIGLITKTPTVNNILGGPSIKLFNYFAYGIAVLDVGLPESTHFLNEAQAGISLRNRSAENIALGIKKLLAEPVLLKKYCENSAAAYARFNWLKEEKKLLAFYEHEILNESELIVR